VIESAVKDRAKKNTIAAVMGKGVTTKSIVAKVTSKISQDKK
jgi:hypothetical protein